MSLWSFKKKKKNADWSKIQKDWYKCVKYRNINIWIEQKQLISLNLYSEILKLTNCNMLNGSVQYYYQSKFSIRWEKNNCEEELCQNTCQNGLISSKSLNLHSFNKYNSKTQLTLNFNKLYYNVFYTILCMYLFSKRKKPIEDLGALLSIVNILNVV